MRQPAGTGPDPSMTDRGAKETFDFDSPTEETKAGQAPGWAQFEIP